MPDRSECTQSREAYYEAIKLQKIRAHRDCDLNMRVAPSIEAEVRRRAAAAQGGRYCERHNARFDGMERCPWCHPPSV